MIYLLETTKWSDNTPNHTYVFENKKSMKCVGYIKQGTTEIQMFSKPMPFTKTRRTFKEIKV